MSKPMSPVVNIDDAPEEAGLGGERWGGFYKDLTPYMRSRGRRLGMNVTRMPPGRVGCPFHSHMLEDEIFYVLSGTGTLRYQEELYPLRPGDCISVPASTGEAFQIANTGAEELVYLGIGPNDPNEVCVYPDSGKVMVRSLQTVGFLKKTEYMEGEPEEPRIFAMAAAAGLTQGE